MQQQDRSIFEKAVKKSRNNHTNKKAHRFIWFGSVPTATIERKKRNPLQAIRITTLKLTTLSLILQPLSLQTLIQKYNKYILKSWVGSASPLHLQGLAPSTFVRCPNNNSERITMLLTTSNEYLSINYEGYFEVLHSHTHPPFLFIFF